MWVKSRVWQRQTNQLWDVIPSKGKCKELAGYGLTSVDTTVNNYTVASRDGRVV